MAISKPWDDSSFVLLVPDDLSSFIEALNNVRLPVRYSALWHRDRRKFEILWTAFPPPVEGVAGRSFAFTWRGNEHKCEFAKASQRALVLAVNYQPVGQSTNNYRNLPSFQLWSQHAALRSAQAEPLSFWIHDIDWNEEDILDLTLHLNFYLKYFDDRSPVVLIHPPTTETTWNPRNRYIEDAFPQTIRSQEIDNNALFLWEAARLGDNSRRFLYYYRIIEYSAVSYLDYTARTALRIALAAPNALDDIVRVTENVVAAVQRMKLDEFQRYEAMIKEVLKPAKLWQRSAKPRCLHSHDNVRWRLYA